MSISPQRFELDQHFRVATLGGAPADEILAAQLVQRRHERPLPHNPGAVFRNHLLARAVAADDKGIAPFARPADIDAIRCRLFASLADIENHGLPPLLAKSLEGAIEGTVDLSLLREGLRQLCLHSSPLAARHVAASQFGPQFLDVVVESNHRVLLPC
jgi:hypothetical protein